MGKRIYLFIVLAIALAVGFVFISQKAEMLAPQQNTKTTAQETARTFSWRFDTKETDDGLPPRTHVALITSGDVYDLGTYAGSCAELAAENLLPNEVAGVLCWWAGGGDEIGVFKEGEVYTVRVGTQEESTAESEGFRGDFRELLVIL